MATDPEVLDALYLSLVGTDAPKSAVQASHLIAVTDGVSNVFTGTLPKVAPVENVANGEGPIIPGTFVMHYGHYSSQVGVFSPTLVANDEPDISKEFGAIKADGVTYGTVNYLSGAVAIVFTTVPDKEGLIVGLYQVQTEKINNGLIAATQMSLDGVEAQTKSLDAQAKAIKTQVLDVITGADEGSIYQRLQAINSAYFENKGTVSVPFGSPTSDVNNEGESKSIWDQEFPSDPISTIVAKWFDISNLSTGNTPGAYASLNKFIPESNVLVGSNLGFAIPRQAKILDIHVSMDRTVDSGASGGAVDIYDSYVSLSRDGTTRDIDLVPKGSTPSSSLTVKWNTNGATVHYSNRGASFNDPVNDVKLLTPDEINNPNFSVMLAISCPTDTPNLVAAKAILKALKVTVYYVVVDITDWKLVHSSTRLENGSNLGIQTVVLYQYLANGWSIDNPTSWATPGPDDGTLGLLEAEGDLVRLMEDYRVAERYLWQDPSNQDGTYGIQSSKSNMNLAKKVLTGNKTAYTELAGVLSRYV